MTCAKQLRCIADEAVSPRRLRHMRAKSAIGLIIAGKTKAQDQTKRSRKMCSVWPGRAHLCPTSSCAHLTASIAWDPSLTSADFVVLGMQPIVFTGSFFQQPPLCSFPAFCTPFHPPDPDAQNQPAPDPSPISSAPTPINVYKGTRQTVCSSSSAFQGARSRRPRNGQHLHEAC